MPWNCSCDPTFLLSGITMTMGTFSLVLTFVGIRKFFGLFLSQLFLYFCCFCFRCQIQNDVTRAGGCPGFFLMCVFLWFQISRLSFIHLYISVCRKRLGSNFVSFYAFQQNWFDWVITWICFLGALSPPIGLMSYFTLLNQRFQESISAPLLHCFVSSDLLWLHLNFFSSISVENSIRTMIDFVKNLSITLGS